MFSQFKKLWYRLCYFLQAKKVWVWPQHSKVLIYDAANHEILLEYLKSWNPEILHVRGEQVYIWVLLKSLFKKGRRVDAYIDCFIEKVRPNLVITSIDNKSTFYTISQRHPDIKTIFIQNGSRGYYTDIFEEFNHSDSDTLDTFFVDHMLVFGPTIGELYSRFIKGNILPIGSFKNNFIPTESSLQRGVIAFISHWKLPYTGRDIKNDFFSYDDLWTNPNNLIIQCLMHYAKEKKKRVVIIPRQLKNSGLLVQEKNS